MGGGFAKFKISMMTTNTFCSVAYAENVAVASGGNGGWTYFKSRVHYDSPMDNFLSR